MSELGQIRIHGHGEVEVQLIAEYLQDLRHAYNSILVFEDTLDRYQRAQRYYSFPIFINELGLRFPARTSPLRRSFTPSYDEISSLVPHSEQLMLSSVRLQSPGFWDFLGKLNPLEVIRQYLNDRHERRKDREYRESAEARRLKLQNLQLENAVIRERVQLAKELGATERDLAPLLNDLVFRPLTGLDRHQNNGVIENAERRRLPPPERRDSDA